MDGGSSGFYNLLLRLVLGQSERLRETGREERLEKRESERERKMITREGQSPERGVERGEIGGRRGAE